MLIPLIGFLSLSGLSLSGLPESAQPRQPGSAPLIDRAVAPSTGATVSLDDAISRTIMRLVLADFRLRRAPTEDDYRAADILLSLAREAAPDNIDVLRMSLDVASSMSDSDRVQELCRRIVKLDPLDTSILYRLIVERISSSPTAEERIRRCARIVGPEGDAIDPSVRSRIATAAAVFQREAGNDEGFSSMLERAIALDSTNLESARLFHDFVSSRIDDPISRVEVLTTMLLAEPMDAEAHQMLAREFARGGAFASARRFLRNADTLAISSGFLQVHQVMFRSLVLDWPIDGPDVPIEVLTNALNEQRDTAAQLLKQYTEALLPTSDLIPPGEVRLDPYLDRIRLLASSSAGNAESLASSAQDLRASYQAAAAGQRGPGAETVARSLRLELVSLLGIAGTQLDVLPAELDLIAASTDPASEELLTARGILFAQTGKADEAVTILTPLAPTRPMARLGLALALENLGRKPEAVSEYAQSMSEVPLEPEGSWAAWRHKSLTGTFERDPAVAAKLRSLEHAIPGWVDRFAESPADFISIGVSIEDDPLGALDITRLKVRVRNISPIPLGIGPRRTISDRVLVSMKGNTSKREYAEATPERLDIGRRLRLMPGEAIDVSLWANPGPTGWLTERDCDESIRRVWRILHDYSHDERGVLRPGPAALVTETDSIVHSPTADGLRTDEELAARVADAPEVEIADVLLALRGRLFDLSDESKRDATATASTRAGQRSLLATAAAVRYPLLSPKGRMVALAVLPHALQVAEMSVFDDVTKSETDPSVGCLVITTRVSAPEDIFLANARASSDPRLSTMARIHGDIIGAGIDAYATVGRDIGGLLAAPILAP